MRTSNDLPPQPITDEHIYEIAEKIRRAVHRSSDDVSVDILAIRYQLPHIDEDRVITALDVLHLLDEVSHQAI